MQSPQARKPGHHLLALSAPPPLKHATMARSLLICASFATALQPLRSSLRPAVAPASPVRPTTVALHAEEGQGGMIMGGGRGGGAATPISSAPRRSIEDEFVRRTSKRPTHVEDQPARRLQRRRRAAGEDQGLLARQGGARGGRGAGAANVLSRPRGSSVAHARTRCTPRRPDR